LPPAQATSRKSFGHRSSCTIFLRSELALLHFELSQRAFVGSLHIPGGHSKQQHLPFQ